MSGSTSPWLATVLDRELAAFEKELSLFPTDRLIWSVAPGISNSAGTLALHVSGNLQHYVGAVLGSTGYVRDRALEFSRRDVPREDLLHELGKTRRVVDDVLATLPPAALDRDYPEELASGRIVTGLFLIHLCTHLAHHLGQVGYLRRVLTGDDLSSGAISLKALSSSPSARS